MGEIGIMVSRLQQEGFDLEDVIDEELRAAGFLELCERTTRTLCQRAVAIEESHASLRRLLDSIDGQLKAFQGNLIPSLTRKDDTGLPVANEEQTERQEPKKTTVIIIDDDEAEYVDVADMSCQATFEDIESETRAQQDKDKANTSSASQNAKSIIQPQASHSEILQTELQVKSIPVTVLTQPSSTSQTITLSKSLPTVSKPTNIALPSVSTTATTGTTPPVIYRTLISPAVSGVPSLPQRVALKSSPPSLPVQKSLSALKPSPGNVSSVVSPAEVMSSSTPSSSVHPPKPSPQPEPSSSESKHTAQNEKSPPVGPPNFEVGTRVIGQRADELWYPGVIEKILTDKGPQKKTKYKVKFDKGARGLLSSNHIALESNPHPSVLNVGSRVVGIYGKLDVLYAGIIAENACAENKNRFLVFFDDGFAQYLPVKKLHHVYHTGKKVWDEVAEHSKEFIQEYLEEFPNRPMVKLKVNQWVKTEWRGQWLKAKVMQLDCSLVKMLFQIDNRSEWLYRGSTRLEPLYSALVDGKISTARKKRSRKLTRGKTTEPFIDYSITKPCLGISPYSKSDPKGEQQRKLEEKRQQTQLEQQRQQEHQEQIRDENKKMSASLVSTKTAATVNVLPVTSTSTVTASTSSVTASTSTVTASTSTVTSATADVNPISSNSSLISQAGSDSSVPKSQGTGPSGKSNGGPGSQLASGTQTDVSQSSSVKPTDSQSSTSCEGAHCSALPETDEQGMGLVNKCGSDGCNGCSDCSNSSMSVIQASTVRKKTSAGLVIPKERLQRPHGVEVIDLDGDGTAAVISVSLESDQIMNSLASQKSEYLVPNMDGSVLDDLYDAWEAPWLRTNRRDIRSTGSNRMPAFQIPANSRRKQDMASLIEQKLNDPEPNSGVTGESEVPRLTVVSNKPPKGPHKCSRLCNSSLNISKEESVKHNPKAIPLLLKWKREIAQRHPGNKKTVYYRTPCNKRLRSLQELASYLAITEASNVSIDQFTFDPDISCQDTVYRDVEPICPDISRGAENVQISVVNEVDTCFPPPIDYVSKRILAEGVNMVLDAGFLACCDCTDNCQDKSKCSCAQLTIQASASVGGKEDTTAGYEFRMLKEGVQTGIYECNQNCACGVQCFNRVVQNGIQLRLQVFKTENRGWGLRCLDDVPMGTFVCTYAGQILNEDMANKEGRDFGDEYLAELDHIEVVEKAKEGYESNMSDLEEDDSVIYQTLGGETTSTASGSENSAESSLSENESSEVDSLFSEDSFSSERNSRHGDGDNTNNKPSRRKKRKRSSRKSEKKRRGVQGEETLMVERESKAHCLSNLADEKWCYIALKRNHDNQKEAAAFLRKMMRGELTAKNGFQAVADNGATNTKQKPDENVVKEAGEVTQELDEEEKNVSQSSDFDFDEVDPSFWQNMQESTLQNKTESNNAITANQTNEDSETGKQATSNDSDDNAMTIIDLTSESERAAAERCSAFKSVDLKSDSQTKEKSGIKVETDSAKLQGPDQPDESRKKTVKPHADRNSDSAPSLISAEDLSKLAAQNPTVADEPPVLTKMSPTRRVSNSLEDMISRLKTRVLTTQPSSSDSSLNGADGPTHMDFEQSAGDVLERCSTDKSPAGGENPLELTAEHISEPSSPDTENIESCPPSPSSMRSDVSRSESLDRKSEVSSGSSRRSAGVSSKPPAKKLKTDKPKIQYSRVQPKPSSTSPSIKASPNTPSPSRPLSRQSSASGRRMSTRLMFGEEHCYVIDAKAYGNCGRYLNHSCSPNLFVQNVFVDTHDLRFPWVAFFTQQNVSAGTELTWDYAYEVDSVKGKVLHCYCGSAECRGRLL